jgi:hypothetical protein
MLITYLFILSGACLITLLIAKRIEEKRKVKPLILRLICRGDEVLRDVHHVAIHWYSLIRVNGEFFFKKQVPMKSRSSLNKFLALIQEKTENYFESLRDSRLLKKPDGISDFFKTMSSVEKGKGEIYEEIYTEKTIDEPTSSEPEEAIQEPVEIKFEIVESTRATKKITEKPKRQKVRKNPNIISSSRKRKIKVVESLEL